MTEKERNIFALSDHNSSSEFDYNSDVDPEFVPPAKRIKKTSKKKDKTKSRSNKSMTQTTQEVEEDDSSNDDQPGPSTSGIQSRPRSRPMQIEEILATLDSDIEDAEEDRSIVLGADAEDDDVDEDASQEEEEAGEDQIVHGQGGGDNDNVFNIFDRAGWTANLHGFPRIIPFTGTPGLNPNIDTDDYSALSCYKLFITDTLIKLLKEETNRYAALLKTLENFRTKKVVQKWKTVTIHEIQGFLLILLHMGAIKKPSLSDYWTTKDFMKSTFAHMIMLRDQFFAIMKMLHFSISTIQSLSLKVYLIMNHCSR